MSVLYYPNNIAHNTDDILTQVEEQRPQRIVMFGETEWEKREITKEFVDRLKELGTTLTVVHGCFKSNHHVAHYDAIGLPLENVVFWGTHFFNYVHMHLSGKQETNPATYTHKEFKHKFISLNNRSHLHRCVFIEEMAKQNLLDEGIVTWIAHLNENSDFPYQYFDGNKRLLNDGFSEHLDSYSLPPEWHESLFEVITESTSHVHFLTEKTIRNLLLKKPFIILGAAGIHGKLFDLGFKLYDEVIDYTFDGVTDLNERTRLFVNNIHNILKYDPKELYELLLPKIIHNYVRAMMIVTDMSKIPNDFKNIPENELFKIYENVTFKKAKYFSIWNSWAGGEDVDNVIPHITGEMSMEPYNMIILHQAVEHAYGQLGPYHDGVDRIIANAKKHNVPVKLITSTKKYENASPLSKESEQYEHLEWLDNPGYWLSDAFHQTMSHRTRNMQNGIDIADDNINLNSPLETLYITLNNVAHPHRCMMMDILAKYDLIDTGAIAWRDIVREFDNDRNEIPDSVRMGSHYYTYRYWTPKRIFLDQPKLNSYVSQEVLPPQYKHAFMQLVNESTVDTFFLTEKTGFALLYNKIFLIIGSKNFHKHLEDMGFKLFHSLFDYSFDSIDDHEARMEGAIQNINKYRNHSIGELQLLLKENEDIIRHNRELALDYVFNQVPDMVNAVYPYLSGQGMASRLDCLYRNWEFRNAFFMAKV